MANLDKDHWKAYLEKYAPEAVARKIIRTLNGYDHLVDTHTDGDITNLANAVRAMLELGYERKQKPVTRLDRKRIRD